MKTACEQCPWRLSNQGKRHKHGFDTKKNLQRLWNKVRKGGTEQSCHLTDPSHPDHIEAGASEHATAQECPGSVIVIMREVAQMANEDGVVDAKGLERYKAARKKGLNKTGLLYWLVSRIQMGGVPYVGGPKMPDVPDDPEVGLPSHLAEG